MKKKIKREVVGYIMLADNTLLVTLSCGHQRKLPRTYFWHRKDKFVRCLQCEFPGGGKGA
jgi:hypothetical protein